MSTYIMKFDYEHANKSVLDYIGFEMPMQSNGSRSLGSFSGDGWSFDNGELTVTTRDGTTNWRTGRCTATFTFADVTSLVFGSGATSTGNFAFADCINLTSVVMPSHVVSINNEAFANTGLTSVTFSDRLNQINPGAFRNTGLTSITFPDSLTIVELDAFANTPWLNSQPDGLVYTGKVAYLWKGSMPPNTSITLKPDTKGIAGRAFQSQINLISIEIPESVTNIGLWAFNGSGLTSVEIHSRVTLIHQSAFSQCANLVAINVCPNNPLFSGDNYGVLFDKDKTRLVQYPIGNPRNTL